MSIWNYVVTAHKPTNVTHSCVGNFTSSQELNLIVAKCTRIEIHLLSPQGLQGEAQDLLFIATERYKFCVLQWDPDAAEVITSETGKSRLQLQMSFNGDKVDFNTERAMGDVSDRIGRPTDNGQIGIIDPDCRLIGLHLYDGLFKVIPFDNKGQLKEAFNIRLEELQVLDIKFLYGCPRPTIVVLYQDNKDARHVKTYEVALKDKDFVEGPWSQNNLDNGADLLIPVPPPLCGVLIIGEETIVYCSASAFKAIPIRPSITRAYGRVDADGSRYLLGDHAGLLHLLVITHEKEKVTGLKIELLGETSIASTISYLDNAVVYVGSSYGDSQLIKLNLHPDAKGSYVEVLESYINLGPIVDFCVVDLERQGQGQVVTCSGAYKDGSLRIVRNGIGINEQASVELQGIKGMWSLRAATDDPHDTFLVVSFISETRILAMNLEDELEETEIEGFCSQVQTLFCHDAVHNQLLQVTSSSVRLVSSISRELRHEWLAPSGFSINVATANATQIGLGGCRWSRLVLVGGLLVGDGGWRFVWVAACLFEEEVFDGGLGWWCFSLGLGFCFAGFSGCQCWWWLQFWGDFVGGLAVRFLVDLQVDDGGDWSKGSVVLVAAISEAGVFSWRRGFDSVAVLGGIMVLMAARREWMELVQIWGSNRGLFPGFWWQHLGDQGGASVSHWGRNRGWFPGFRWWFGCFFPVWSRFRHGGLFFWVLFGLGSTFGSQVLLATGGGHLVYLEIGDGTVTEVKHAQLEYEVSCLDMNPIGENPNYSQLAAVGMWTDISVIIFSIPDLNRVTKENLGGEIIPRSVLLCSFEGISYLLCALGDGHLLNFLLNMSTGELTDRKKVSLGTQPITLRTFSSKNTTHVFAASDRPTVIYSSNKKLLYSNVNLKEVSHMCPFNSAAFPDSLAIAKEGELTIGTIDDIQKLHIRSIPLGEHARRICHQEQTRTFAICSLKYNQSSTEEAEMHFIRLLDDQTFEFISTYALDQYEYACSILSCSFSDDGNVYYCVGTAYVMPEENEPSKGRIIVFAVEDQKLVLITEKETKGAVYSLNAFNGKLLAAINQKIQLYKWMLRDDGTRELQSECGHHGHILALYVQTRGDFIVVGDLMKSISLLIYKHEEGAIEERARDYNANWMSAVEILDDDIYLGGENNFNLFTVRKNSEGATDEERGRLEVVGEYHLGEFVNRFRHGSLVMRLPDSDVGQIPTVIFGTVNGVIGVIASLPHDQYQFFEKLQSNLRKVIKGVGGLSHEQWRSFYNEKKTSDAKNFLDGDLIESFLDLGRARTEEISKAMNVPVEELMKRVEELTRLH
ncbi:hypothetical protein RHMOL_Rhmol13G0160800 [Rhododendron molle]|uniref:Uncharacterized protein n=1 Tax=Rhododendron molle TaxID=49168 RepID=A0ACC0L792_RHOML|nr:hypothetical protein RHMOL_Rhmol13G0160800 [Rhododendron molle]